MCGEGRRTSHPPLGQPKPPHPIFERNPPDRVLVKTARPQRRDDIRKSARILDRRRDHRAIEIRSDAHAIDADSVGQILEVVDQHVKRRIGVSLGVGAHALRLADTGCVIEFDLFDMEQSYYPHSDIDVPNDAIRLRLIRALISRGHLERVVISHDICHRTRLMRCGGHGYQHIHANVIPMMRRGGCSESEIETIMVRTPRRLLTFV
jgi:hypothetical protein